MTVMHYQLRFRSFAVIAGLVFVHGIAIAQDSVPHIGYVYPAGGQQGSTVEVTIGGQRIGQVTDAYVSGGGIKAELLKSEPIPTGKEAQNLRDQLQKVREEKKSADQPASDLAAIRHKLALFEKARVAPAIGELAHVKITISQRAVLGNREIRLNTPAGLSNPLVFQIGEYSEAQARILPPDDDFNRIRNSIVNPVLRIPPGTADRTPVSVQLPATLNGQLLPGCVDRFRFPARKGQNLVVIGGARELIPYIADAVPGWVQLSVVLLDSHGKELVPSDQWRLTADPVLRFEIPADDDYIVEIADALYRGRDDFIYRVRLGEIPWVTSVFPLGIRAGNRSFIELQGWNLPTSQLSLDARFTRPGVYPLEQLVGNSPVPNPLHFEVSWLAETIENEPNDSIEQAQPIKVPVVVNGRIDRPSDIDIFSFTGSTGATLVAETIARRLDSPVDTTLALFDSSGNQLAFNDDHEDKASGLLTHQADSFLTYKLPAAGKYFIQVADAQQKGGRDFGYRLRVSLPQPDFSLRIVPSMINFRPNSTQPLTVRVLRREGFAGEVELTLKDAPPGFYLDGGLIPAGRDMALCTITAPAKLKGPLSLKLVGTTTSGRTHVERPAVAAEDMMQAFFYRHLVPSAELLVDIQGNATANVQARIFEPTPVKIPIEGTASVRIITPAYTPAEIGQLKLVDPPDGITLKSTARGSLGVELTFEVNPEKVKPGTKGNLLVSFGNRNPKQIPLGCLPAIAYEVAGVPENNKR